MDGGERAELRWKRLGGPSEYGRGDLDDLEAFQEPKRGRRCAS